jgi:hypothetical protein
VRLAGLGDRLSDAEGYSWLVAAAPSVEAFFDRLAAYENTPPLFYALLAPLPDGDEAWLRLPALIPSLACIPVLYALVRPLLGTPAALLSALALAVAPFHVSYANYSRGFMLAGLGVLLAAWAVARLARGRSGRWWWLYVAGGAVALHAEYDSILFLAPLLLVPPLVRARGWREAALVGAVPLLTLLPLAGEMLAGLDQIDVTKRTPPTPGLSPASLRDSLVSLFAGTHGLADSAALRWVQALAVAGALVAGAVLVGRGLGRLGTVDAVRRSVAVWVLAIVPLAAALLHVAVSAAGPDMFDARYLTPLIPFGVALVAAGVIAVPWRPAVPVAAAALVALAVAVFVQRHDRELQPDYAPVAAYVDSIGARTVLTNTPVAAYYLRDRDVRLDRPFGLGNREPRCAAACPKPLAIVEDARLPGGLRGGPGTVTAFGPIAVRVR